MICDKLCESAGLWAGKAIRKIACVCSAFALKARLHVDNVPGVIDHRRRFVLEDSDDDDDSDDDMGEPVD